MTEYLHMLLDALLGGGLLVTLVTLRSTRKKALADAQQAVARANSSEIEGAKDLLQAYAQYITSPIITEVEKLRNETRLQNIAISRSATCSHVDSCPVVAELQERQKYISDTTPIKEGSK